MEELISTIEELLTPIAVALWLLVILITLLISIKVICVYYDEKDKELVRKKAKDKQIDTLSSKVDYLLQKIDKDDKDY